MLSAVLPRIGPRRALALLLSVTFLLFCLPSSSPAYKKKTLKQKRYTQRRIRRTRHYYRSALLLDAKTGRVLRAYRPRLRIYPASVTKMMTTLIVLEELEKKRVRLQDTVRISRSAQRVGGQQVYLRRGERFRLEDLMKAVMITSANDAAYAVAEHVGRTAPRFVRMMNLKTRQLGMTDTRFVNPNGLPPRRGRPANIMSARDAGILARELLKHPLVLSWTSRRTAPFRGQKYGLVNTNRLLGKYQGVDGLKTGYYRRAGFNLVATAKRNNVRLVSIVFGSRSSGRRFLEAKKLLSWGFARHTSTQVPTKKNSNGRASSIQLNDSIRLARSRGGMESFLRLSNMLLGQKRATPAIEQS